MISVKLTKTHNWLWYIGLYKKSAKFYMTVQEFPQLLLFVCNFWKGSDLNTMHAVCMHKSGWCLTYGFTMLIWYHMVINNLTITLVHLSRLHSELQGQESTCTTQILQNNNMWLWLWLLLLWVLYTSRLFSQCNVIIIILWSKSFTPSHHINFSTFDSLITYSLMTI